MTKSDVRSNGPVHNCVFNFECQGPHFDLICFHSFFIFFKRLKLYQNFRQIQTTLPENPQKHNTLWGSSNNKNINIVIYLFILQCSVASNSNIFPEETLILQKSMKDL